MGSAGGWRRTELSEYVIRTTPFGALFPGDKIIRKMRFATAPASRYCHIKAIKLAFAAGEFLRLRRKKAILGVTLVPRATRGQPPKVEHNP